MPVPTKIEAKGIDDEDVPYDTFPHQAVVRVENGKLIVRQRVTMIEATSTTDNATHTQYQSKTFVSMRDASNVVVFDMNGNRLAPKVWKDKLKMDTHVLIAYDGRLPNPREMTLFKEDTLLVVMPALPNTPAPSASAPPALRSMPATSAPQALPNTPAPSTSAPQALPSTPAPAPTAPRTAPATPQTPSVKPTAPAVPAAPAPLPTAPQSLSTPPSAAVSIKIYTLKKTDAQLTATLLRNLFTGQTARTGTAGGGSGTGVGTAASTNAITQTRPLLQIAVDDRTNSVIAAGTQNDLETINAIIARLESADVADRYYNVFKLHNTAAANVAAAITSYITGSLGMLSGASGVPGTYYYSNYNQLQKNVGIIAEPVSNTLLISATPFYFKEMKRLIERIDAPLVQVPTAPQGIPTAPAIPTPQGIPTTPATPTPQGLPTTPTPPPATTAPHALPSTTAPATTAPHALPSTPAPATSAPQVLPSTHAPATTAPQTTTP